MREMLPPVRRPLFLLLLLTAQLGCLADYGSPATPQEPRALVSGVVDVMEARSFKRSQVDWTRLRDSALSVAAGARTVEEAHPAMQVALALLGDNHSWLRLPDGSFLTYPKTINCAAPRVSAFRRGVLYQHHGVAATLSCGNMCRNLTTLDGATDD